MAYLPAPAFFIIAFVFSVLSMGGSQPTIPNLLWTGMAFKTEAIPLGLLLKLGHGASAALTYGRKGIVAWRVALPLAAYMIVFAPLGAWLNLRLPAKPLLAFFALFTASAAVLLGSQLGARAMAERKGSTAVKRVSAIVVLGVAALILVKDVVLS